MSNITDHTDRAAALLDLSIIHNLPTSTTSNKSSALDLLALIFTIIGTRQLPEISQYLIALVVRSIDTLSVDQRLSFAKADSTRMSDSLLTYLLGVPTNAAYDTWLGLVMSATQQQQSSSTQSQPMTTPASSAQSQTQSQLRTGSVPRTPLPAGGTQHSTQSTQPVSSQQRGGLLSNRPGATVAQSSNNKVMAPPVPFPLKPWEMLPDQGGITAVNDTAINLTLFSARKA
jgi:hypothetical protein